MRKVILIAGTGAGNPAWIEDAQHPFRQELAAADLEVALSPKTGLPYRWDTSLSGLFWFGRLVWPRAAAVLQEFIESVPYDDLNLIGHSHGGNVGVIAIAALCGYRRVRSFTTIATPRRSNLPNELAASNCGYWQHCYDPKHDWIATLPQPVRRTLGQLTDGEWSLDRSFRYAGIVNKPIRGMSHSRMFNSRGRHLWQEYGILRSINARLPGDE